MRYGASKEDGDKVKEVLAQHGITTKEISLSTRSMIVTGSVAQMEETFHPDLGIYEDDEQGQFRDRGGNYTVPAELKGIITSVLGFGQRQVARRKAAAQAAAAHAATLAPLTPGDLEARYQFPDGTAMDKHRNRRIRRLFCQRRTGLLREVQQAVAEHPRDFRQQTRVHAGPAQPAAARSTS